MGPNQWDYDLLGQVLFPAATRWLPQQITWGKQADFSQEAAAVLEKRGQAIRNRDSEEVIQALTKSLRKQRRKDRMQAAVNSVDRDLDVRDRFLGLRYMQAKYAPRSYLSGPNFLCEAAPTRKIRNSKGRNSFLEKNRKNRAGGSWWLYNRAGGSV